MKALAANTATPPRTPPTIPGQYAVGLLSSVGTPSLGVVGDDVPLFGSFVSFGFVVTRTACVDLFSKLDFVDDVPARVVSLCFSDLVSLVVDTGCEVEVSSGEVINLSDDVIDVEDEVAVVSFTADSVVVGEPEEQFS